MRIGNVSYAHLHRRRKGRPVVVVLGMLIGTMLVGALLGPVQASAHVPSLEGSAGTSDSVTPLPIPDVSRAIYGYLAPGETSDRYTFTVPKPVTTTLGIIVPAYPENAAFRPTLVLETSGEPPVTISDPGLEPRAKEWEPFSLAHFWKGGEQTVDLAPGHRYTLRVEPGNGAQSGRYVIVVGGAESFTGADTLATFRSLPVIWAGMYGGAPFRWNGWALIPAVVLVGSLVIVFLGVRGAFRRPARK
jgi:hypothetical protein